MSESQRKFERGDAGRPGVVPGHGRGLDLLVAAALGLVTLAVFSPVLGNGFLLYDDSAYVTDNPHVRSGLTGEGIRWAFTSGYAANWHPLTWLSHMLDATLFGLGPAGHHGSSVLLHAANAALLFLVFERMTGARWRSGFAAGLFALHPLHVESVAWIAERKDLLSGLFAILTIGAYALWVEKRGPLRYGIVLALFALGLMSKPMLVTLPFVLLLLDHWPLRRVRWRMAPASGGDPFLAKGSAGPGRPSEEEVPATARRMAMGRAAQRGSAEEPVRTVGAQGTHRLPGGERLWPDLRCLALLVLEKTPLLALAGASSILTFFVQRYAGAVAPVERFPLARRAANAVVALVRYLGKTIWPDGLSVFYPHPDAWAGWQVAGAGLVLVGITVAAVVFARRAPWLATGWFWYAGMMVPVIGLVQVGMQAMADRYTYLPLIGIFLVVSWGGCALAARLHIPRPLLASMAGCVLVVCALMTLRETRYWKDTVTLFERALEVTERNAVAHNILANALAKQERIDEAIGHFEAALALLPHHETYTSYAFALAVKGRFREAILNDEAALGLKPDYAPAHAHLAEALDHEGRSAEAVHHYREALRSPTGKRTTGETSKIRAHLGACLAGMGRMAEALPEYEEAIRLDPTSAEPRNNLCAALLTLGRPEQAEPRCREALTLDPRYVDAHYNLGSVLLARGNAGEALREYRETLALKPGDAATLAAIQYAERQEAIGARGRPRR